MSSLLPAILPAGVAIPPSTGAQTFTSPTYSADPPTVYFVWERADGLITVWQYGVVGQITRIAAGLYSVTMPHALPGTDIYQWSAAGQFSSSGTFP